MKIRISATIDEETKKILDLILDNGNYRNKSHLIESAILSLTKGLKNGKSKK